MDPTALWHTAALVHLLDAILCCVIANYSGRNKTLWMMIGAIGGIWALGVLFLLPAKHSSRRRSPPVCGSKENEV